jgi:hypothetical protein
MTIQPTGTEAAVPDIDAMVEGALRHQLRRATGSACGATGSPRSRTRPAAVRST